MAAEGYPAAKLSENGVQVLRARYLKKNEDGEVIEAPEDLFRRVAHTVAAVEQTYGASADQVRRTERDFYLLMIEGRFMPNSPTLMNAGREMGMLSACFVLPVPDSVEGIFDSVKHTALIQKAGGGTGFAFDALRPTGDFIRSSGGTTSGPISFWRAFSEATNAIQQGAFRRGANMGMMYIHHPDILKFLYAKQDLNQFTNYNISVKVTDEWMEGFNTDPTSPHIVRNPRTGETFYLPKDLKIWEYDIRVLIPTEKVEADPDRPGFLADGAEVYTKQDIWNIIVNHAWETGEPGVAFIDRINQYNPTPQVGRIEATNPCGEQPLLPYEACNLGSVNLGCFIKNPCTPEARVDWDALRETVHLSTRFLDDVIDANNYPLEQIDRVCKANRKIGLGVMGFADALYKLGVGYNTEEGVAWGERFMKFVNDEAHNYSEKLADERGVFPNFPGSRWDTEWHRRVRNSAVTTVAPTGTISIIADCSGGVEPMFNLVFYRNVLRERKNAGPMLEVNRTFLEVAKERGFYSDEMMDRIARDGTLAQIEGIPQDIKRVFVCAHDVEPQWHIRMQAAFQKHCDSSISKTINFPHSATVQDVETIYMLAYELGCKGVTVYRDGCRVNQPMALAGSGEQKKFTEQQVRERVEQAVAAAWKKWSQRPLEPAQMPEIVSGLRLRQVTPFGNMHVKITVDPKRNKEFEVFAQLGKGGDVASSDLEAICRMISLWLRSGGSLAQVIKQIKGIGSSLQVPSREGRVTSLADGLARALEKYQRAKEMFGLRALLLGEADLDALRPPAKHMPSVPGLGRKRSGRSEAGRDGNGGNGGNGHDEEEGNGSGMSLDERLGLDTQPAVVTAKTAYKVKCPECGGALALVEGCRVCYGCGYSAC